LTKAVPARKSGARRGGSQTAPASLALEWQGEAGYWWLRCASQRWHEQCAGGWL